MQATIDSNNVIRQVGTNLANLPGCTTRDLTTTEAANVQAALNAGGHAGLTLNADQTVTTHAAPFAVAGLA